MMANSSWPALSGGEDSIRASLINPNFLFPPVPHQILISVEDMAHLNQCSFGVS